VKTIIRTRFRRRRATHPQITPAWKEFFRYPVSADLCRHPAVSEGATADDPSRLEERAGRPLEQLRVAVRDKDDSSDKRPRLTAALANPPVTARACDRPTRPSDETLQRSVVLSRPTTTRRAAIWSSIGGWLLAYSTGSSVRPNRVVAAKRITYRANRPGVSSIAVVRARCGLMTGNAARPRATTLVNQRRFEIERLSRVALPRDDASCHR
jgi:hypothetical protein